MLAVVVTAFTKVTIVLLILRNALGIQQTPPNIVIYSIAIILSALIMQPVLQSSANRVPVDKVGTMTMQELGATASSAAEPFRNFMIDNTSESSRQFFTGIAQKRSKNPDVTAVDFIVLIPAFLMDELTKSFNMGFLIYIPFIAIDFIVGAILIALGMQMMSATAIATPLKILLFVEVQGWERMFDMLLMSYK